MPGSGSGSGSSAPGLATPVGAGGVGMNAFTSWTGNAYRMVEDLPLFAGAGEHILNWKRIHNTRFTGATSFFGQGGNWRHSYQWEMAAAFSEWGGPESALNIYYPDGRVLGFWRLGEETNEWRSLPFATEYLTKTNDVFELHTSEGWTYRFVTLTNESGNFYQMQNFSDSQQNLYVLTYDTNNLLDRISEPAGRFLQVGWQDGRISSITNSDGRGVSYSYQLFDTNDQNSEIVLISVNYAGAVQASYTYSRQLENMAPVMLTASDPYYHGGGAQIKYEYSTNEVLYNSPYGFVVRELNPITDQILVEMIAGHPNREVIVPGVSSNSFSHYNGVVTSVWNMSEANSQTRYYTLEWTYGYIDSMTDALGQKTYFTNSHLNNLLARVQVDGGDSPVKSEFWTRDDLDLVLTYVDPLGRTNTYTRDSSHRITRIDYPDGTYETFAYNSLSKVTQHRLKSGGTNSFAYTTNALCTHFTNAIGYVTAYTYDAYDRLASVIDARGNTNSYTYDARGYLVKATHPDASWVGFGYDNYGNRIKQTNELGKVWTWNFNELNQMTNAIDPLNRITTYEYTLGAGGGGCCGGGGGMSSAPTKIITPSGRTNVFQYDAEGRKVAEIVAYGTAEAATNRFEYDAVGNLTNRIDALGNSWKAYYNELRQPIAAVDPLDRTNSWTYDLLGNKVSETRADGTTTSFGYDSMSRLIATTNALGHIETYGYDVLGNLIQLVDTKGNTNQWAYDLLGHRLSKTYSDSTRDRYAYDAVGNLAYFTNAASEVQTIAYDSRNRPTLKSWSANGDTEAITYDSAGRLLTLTNSISVLTNSYDDANQLTAESSTLYAQSTRTVSYTYNLDGQRQSLTYPAGTVITNDYNARGLLASISANGPPPLATFGYDARGFRTYRAFENGVDTYYTNDAAGQLLALAHVKTNGGSVLVQIDYGYNEVANRTNRVESFTGFSSATDVYAYDSTDQLTNVNYSGGARVVGYDYDPMGNLTNRTDTTASTTTFTANNLNQLATQNGTNLTYDAKGNLLTRLGWAYTWNAKNQLTIAEQSNPTEGSKKMTFAYDGRYRCAKRRTYTYTSGNWSLTLDTCLYYDGWNLIEERDSNGDVIAAFANGPVTDEVLAKSTSTNTVFFHGDAQNSALVLSDASANVIERYRYDAFGVPSIYDSAFSTLSSSAYSVRHLFQGREWLTEVKLNDHRYRHYAPELQRWISRDLVGELDSDNLYMFIHNNPLRFVDEFGLTSSSSGYSQCMQAAQQAFLTCTSMPITCSNGILNHFPNAVQALAILRRTLLAPCKAFGLIGGIACGYIIARFVLMPALRVVGSGFFIAVAGVAGYGAGCGISFVWSAQNCAYVHYGISPAPMN